MRISDWSSDVCSSDLQPIQREHLRGPAIDLAGLQPRQALRDVGQAPVPLRLGLGCDWMIEQAQRARGFAGQWQTRQRIGPATRRVGDRKSVVEGKGVAVRVDSGGRRTLKEKKK